MKLSEVQKITSNRLQGLRIQKRQLTELLEGEASAP